ncbi:MAG: potassium channel family protein [Candidatus Competibacter sp.]
MLMLLLIAVLLVALTVVLHATGTTYWIRYAVRRYADHNGDFKPHTMLPAVMWTAITLMLLHAVEVVLWAVTYRLLSDDQFDNLEKSLYFSVVTFTTLGYGDITMVDSKWRLLSGIEALDGILLVGWSTALLFIVVQRSWKHLGPGHQWK